MIKIYPSVSCLLAVCCEIHLAFLFKREIQLCVCILERLVLQCAVILFFRFSTPLRAGERVEGFSTIRSYSELHYALNITAFVLTLFLSQKIILLLKTGRDSAIQNIKVSKSISFCSN